MNKDRNTQSHSYRAHALSGSSLFMVGLMLVSMLMASNVASAQSKKTNGQRHVEKNTSTKPAQDANADYQRMIAYQGRTCVTDTQPNTIHTMLRAIDRHPYAVHADIRITSDDNIILYASDDLDGLYIPDSPYKLLAEHPAYSRDNVVLLKQYLTKGLLKLSRESSSTSLLLEMHSSGRTEQDMRFADQLADVIASFEEMNPSKYIILSSSDFSLCERLRMRLPHIRIFYQGRDIDPEKLSQAGINGLYCDIKTYYAHPEIEVQSSAVGMVVAVQPVSNEVDQVKLIDMGVQYLATDNFDRLAPLFHKVKR